MSSLVAHVPSGGHSLHLGSACPSWNTHQAPWASRLPRSSPCRLVDAVHHTPGICTFLCQPSRCPTF